ncbi:MAG TPA: class I SAM-dependent methyltransferase, partial [Burkholderiaceae bacterium]|nr:class I SAM-dependent methyltransferase [Burkholderiaceae bacterium]
GYGRVFLPMHHGFMLTDLFGCDVNGIAVRYLKTACRPRTHLRATDYNPPLPFSNGAFDCVYSISIWTHLPVSMQIAWLEEIRRILKPGGLALISTSGHRALKSRHARADKDWSPISSDDLRREGIIYREYQWYAKQPDKFPGITSSYGQTAHCPLYIEREWSKVMPVLSVQETAIGVAQDLVVMRRE